jgi:two-component system, OmpR family, phosphate regulon sensor histidine kinase PhoR
VLGCICLAGIIVMQVYWVKKVFDISETQFDVNVSLGLKNVSDSIALENGVAPFAESPVTRLTSNYFVVNQPHPVAPVLLERFIKNEFAKRGLQQNFGLVMYQGDKLAYSKCITFRSAVVDTSMLKQIPELAGSAKLSFGIYFPAKAANLASGMYIWIFSSCILLIVIVFFAYAMLTILKQKRLSEIQRDFVNNMAHEFQTPIAAIMASAEVIKNPAIVSNTQRLSSYAAIIETEARKLSSQVQRILEMAGAESDEVILNKSKVDVHELIKQTRQKFVLATGIDVRQISLHLDAGEHVIEADVMHLSNIIYNLMDNAVKYANGTPLIRIVTTSEKNGIVIKVADNGIGIAPDDLKKIFNKFYRVSQGNRHDVKGFGLGLSFVKLMVDAHRGSIDVRSKLNEGTTFILFFPMK